MKTAKLFLLIAVIVAVTACQKDNQESVERSMDDLQISSGFDWKLTRNIDLNIYMDEPGLVRITSADGNTIYHKGYAAEKGNYQVTVNVPKTVDQLSINGTINELGAFKSGSVNFKGTSALDFSFGSVIVFRNTFVYSPTSLALDDSRFLMTYGTGYYGPLYARVATRVGDNITYGPEYQVPGSNWAYYNTATNMAKIDDTRVLYGYKAYPNGGVLVMTINGDAITFGTPALSNHVMNFPSVVMLDNDKFIFSTMGDGTNIFYCYVGTISGTSVSLGTEATRSGTHMPNGYKLDGSTAIYAFRNNNTTGGKWLPAVMLLRNYNQGFVNHVRTHNVSQSNAIFTYLSMLDNNRFIYAYQDSDDGQKGKVVLGNVTGDIISTGTPVVFNDGVNNELHVLAYDANTFVLLYGKINGTSYSTHYRIGYIDGDNITFGTEKLLINNRTGLLSMIKHGSDRILATMFNQPNGYTVTQGLNFLSETLILDADGDGIADEDDDYPTDPDRAFDNFFPAAGYGSLGFEDLWPGKGDYDFNDIVVDYRFHTVTNANNKVVEIFADFPVKASGAYLVNGFGFNLPDANPLLTANPDQLNVTGYSINGSYINLNSYGYETGQTHPTMIVFDNVFDLLPPPGTGLGVNTVPTAPFVEFDTVNLTITTPGQEVTAADFSLYTWNPFIIADQERGHEIHLPDYPPTDLMDNGLLGQWEDDSDPVTGKYFKTYLNLPWAIDIPSSFGWPTEKTDITGAYLKFAEWAESSGTLYTDWYEDNPGYRNDANIYQVP